MRWGSVRLAPEAELGSLVWVCLDEEAELACVGGPGGQGDAYLVTLRGAEQANTCRAYGQVLRRMAAEYGAETALGGISAEQFAAWFGSQWASRSPSTWNVALDAVMSTAAYWRRQGWIDADPSRMLSRRKPRPDRARALTHAEVEQLLTRDDVSLRERTFWRMLYETAARSAELLARCRR